MAGVLACGQKGMFTKGVRPVQIDPIRDSDPAARLVRARTAAASGELRCAFEEECHPSVALVSIVTSQGLARCSGVLIAEDEVLTNDHCVSQSLSVSAAPTRLTDLPCKDEIYVHFAATGGLPATRAACATIRTRSGEDGVSSVDYAVLKLDRKIPGRTPVSRAASGFSDAESASIFRVQMDGDGSYGGTQSLLKCEASHSTFLYPQLSNADLPLMTFGDCNIQLGNSGSPVLNARGELAAVLQGYLVVREESDIQKEVEQALLEGGYGLTAVATQMKCLGIPGKEAEGAGNCAPIPPLESLTVADFLGSRAPWKSEILPVLESGWKWGEVKSTEVNRKHFRSSPVCGGSLEFEAEELRYRKGLDSKLKAAWKVESTDSGKLRFARSGDPVDAVVTYAHPTAGQIRLPVCTGAPVASSP